LGEGEDEEGATILEKLAQSRHILREKRVEFAILRTYRFRFSKSQVYSKGFEKNSTFALFFDL
jgi:hypothetical protein